MEVSEHSPENALTHIGARVTEDSRAAACQEWGEPHMGVEMLCRRRGDVKMGTWKIPVPLLEKAQRRQSWNLI